LRGRHYSCPVSDRDLTSLLRERVARGTIEVLPIDDRTFLVDAGEPDTPAMTFGAFDDSGRPGALYQMLWGLPRRAGPARAGGMR
jgi:hypothetical protein